jgi:RNA polymerase sigma factor (sigma-70 family)
MPPFDSTPPPLGPPGNDRKALLNDLCKQHGGLIQRLLDHRNDVPDESKKDLAQRILLILCAHVEKTGKVPEKMGGYLKEVVRKEVRNHKGRWRPAVEDGADVAEQSSTEDDPEGTAELRELREKLDRYVADLPEACADVIRCTYLLEMTLDETAAALGRPRSTVYSQLESARERLDELARNSERSAAERARGPARGRGTS